VKRGCLIVLIAVPVIVISALAYAYYNARSTYGLAPAEPVSHDTIATPETRMRLVISRDKLLPYLIGLLPPTGIPMPWYVEQLVGGPAQALEEFLPYEVALLGSADYKDNRYNTTLFVNERVLGPLFTQLVQAQMAEQEKRSHSEASTPSAQFFRSLKFQEGYIDNSTRGVVRTSVGLPLPAGMQNRVLRSWPVDKSASTEKIEGGNLVELLVDNKTGELMTILGTVGKANNQTLDQVFAIPDIEPAIRAIDVFRAAGNLTGDDELTVVFKVSMNTDDFMTRMKILAAFTVGFEGTVAMGQPGFIGAKGELAKRGLIADYLDGQKPTFDGNMLVASFVVTGFRPVLQQQVDALAAQLATLQ